MEPFSISCTTCQARLRVKDESAIGQILACPKCGSMVMIETPTVDATSQGPVETQDQNDQRAAQPKAAPPKATNPKATNPKAPQQTGRKAASPKTTGTPPKKRTPAPAKSPSKTPATSSNAPPPKAPAGTGAGDTSQGKAVSGAASPTVPPSGAAPAGGKASDTPAHHDSPQDRPARTFKFREDFEMPEDGALETGARKPVTPAPPKQAATHAAEQEEDVSEASGAPVPLHAAVSPSTQRVRQWLLIGGAAVIGIVLALLVVAVLSSLRSQEPEPVAKKTPTRSDKQGQTTKRKKAPSDTPKPDAKVAPPAKGTAKQGDVDDTKKKAATTGDEGAKQTADAASTDDTEGSPDSKLPPDLTASGDTATGDAASGDAATGGPDDMSGTGAEPPIEPAVPTTDVDPPAHDGVGTPTEAQLSMPIVAIEFKSEDEIRLADFATFILHLTTIPVTLDVDALRAVGITSETVMEVQMRGATVGQVVTTALEPLEVSYRVGESGIIVSPDVASRDAMSERTYDVADLAGDNTALNILATQITTLIAPTSWDSAAGTATLAELERSLEVLQTPAAHYQITRFLERLRTAQGLITRSELAPEEIELAPAFILAAGELNSPVAAIFAQPTAIQKILESLQAQTDLRVLADWESLSEQGIYPSAAFTMEFPEQPFFKLLTKWLATLKLDFRVVDAHTVQIGSQSSIEARPELELYRIESVTGTDMDKLIAELETRIGAPFFATDGGTGVILHDKQSKCLLVSLPQPQQRIVAAWLRINRKTLFDGATDR